MMVSQGDPRLAVIGRRLARVARVVPVMSSKGGVGKTLLSCLLALALSERGARVGLLDLDVTNPTAHVVLGADLSKFPEEDRGVVPPLIGGVKFMSVAYYSGENPLPLRGWEIDNVVREVLAVTIWGDLDFLVIDTPPGIGDEVLDVLSYFPKHEPLVVATPSPLTVASVRRLLKLLTEAVKGELIRVVENMARDDSDIIADLAKKFHVGFLGKVRFDEGVDRAVGDIDALRESRMYKDVSMIAEKLL